MILLQLFWGFLKVGLFTFGGGYAAIPLIREVVLEKGWLTEEALTHMIAVSESTPGPIMVNMATYVGSSQAGLPGAALATFAVVLPSFLIIQLVLLVLKKWLKHPAVQSLLGGMQAAVIGIILATGLSMTVRSCFSSGAADPAAVLIAVILLALVFGGKSFLKKKVSPISLILLSAVLGMVLYTPFS